MLAFSFWTLQNSWAFVRRQGEAPETLTFMPSVSMNDYNGLAAALVAGTGIGDLPPIVQPELMLQGQLVEVMPNWRFPTFDLSIVHLGTATSRVPYA